MGGRRRRTRGARSPSLALLALCPWAVFTGCGTSARQQNQRTEASWRCAENADVTSCSCERIPGDVNVFRPGEVPYCEDYPCCLHAPDRTTQFGTGACECLDSADCAAEAGTRPGATVVPSCPPDVTIPPPRCAREGENCRYQYLLDNDLEGCCAGSVCRWNAEGIPACQPASEEEVTFAARCSKFARGSETEALELVTPTLATSVGTLTLPPIMYGFLEVGPLGCVSSLSVVLSEGSGCRFTVDARAEGGAMVLSGISGDFADCAGYAGGSGAIAGVFSLAAAEGTMTFSGAACDGALIFESYAVSGRFDFHLGGGTSNGITLPEQHIVFEGSVSGGEPSGECAVSP
jgi:hypothetical protein